MCYNGIKYMFESGDLMENNLRQILHVDMNSFYASVECKHNPAIRNDPVVVGGNEKTRHGIVLAKNDLAKKYGIKTAETLWEARRKCPHLVVVPPHYDKYALYSKMAREIYLNYTDQIEPFGLDEAWLDVTGSKQLFGSGREIGQKLRKQIKNELGLTVSVGVSFNKVFAKLGSDMKKPDAVTEISYEGFREKIWPLPLNEMLFAGRKTAEKLKFYNIHTIGDLAGSEKDFLIKVLGKHGLLLWEYANGLDRAPVSKYNTVSRVKSVGNSTTLQRDLKTDEELKIILYVLSESVAARLREKELKAKGVQITVRDNSLKWFNRQGQLDYPCNTSQEIFNKAYELIKKYNTGAPVRLLGVCGINLVQGEMTQMSFIPDFAEIQKHEQLEETIDSLRERFGPYSVQRGLMHKDMSLSRFNPKDEHVGVPTPYFR